MRRKENNGSVLSPQKAYSAPGFFSAASFLKATGALSVFDAVVSMAYNAPILETDFFRTLISSALSGAGAAASAVAFTMAGMATAEQITKEVIVPLTNERPATQLAVLFALAMGIPYAGLSANFLLYDTLYQSLQPKMTSIKDAAGEQTAPREKAPLRLTMVSGKPVVLIKPTAA